MSEVFEWYTLERRDGDGSCWLVGHGVYPESSVLAGQERVALLEWFGSLKEAREAHPDAEVLPFDQVSRSSARCPDIPPADFDPLACGEVWHEEDY